jgi:hypothetical protein
VRETVGLLVLVVMASVPVLAVVSGCAVTVIVTLWPRDNRSGNATVPEKTLVEYVRLLIVTAPPTAVIFSGCDETLPVDPLKLSEVLESETEPVAQHGAAQRLTARGRRMCFFTGERDS